MAFADQEGEYVDDKGDISLQIERVELYFAFNNVDKDHEDFTFLAWSWRGSLVRRSSQYLSVQKISFLAIVQKF